MISHLGPRVANDFCCLKAIETSALRLLLVTANIDDLPMGYVCAVLEAKCLYVAEIAVAREGRRHVQ